MENLTMLPATSGCKVYFQDNLTHGCDVYFDNNTTYPYRALIFQTEGEAKAFLKVLKSHYHPSVCDVLPLDGVPVGGNTVYMLPCEKAGRSLTAMIRAQNARGIFYDGRGLSDFSRNLLMDLFTVIHNFIGTPVKVSVHPDHIFLVDGHWTLVGLSKREGQELGSYTEYREIVDLINFILNLAGNNGDLRRFHDILVNANKSAIRHIYEDPIFWTKRERMDFPTVLWDSYEKSGMSLVVSKPAPRGGPIRESPFVGLTLAHVYWDQDLYHWYCATESTQNPPLPPALPPIIKPNDPLYLHSEDEYHARTVLNFTRKCGAHFEQNVRSVQALNQETEDGLLVLLEDFFPNFIFELYKVGCRLKDHSGCKFVMPEQSSLKGLVDDDDGYTS